MKRIYLDHSATTPVDSRVAEVMREFMLSKFGNPSSLHSFGHEAKQGLEAARRQVASLLNCSASELYFTSGGTEADNLALLGYAASNPEKGNHVIIGSIEHPAVRNAALELENRGFEITRITPDPYGKIYKNDVRDAIRENTSLVSVMHVNNEVGTINDVAGIASVCKTRGVVFHTDAVQSFGKIPIDVRAMGIDMASISSHKIYGPKGIGALYIRQGLKLLPRTFGGHQEDGVRVGTENLPGIMGLGKAAEICSAEIHNEAEKLSHLRDSLYQMIMKELDNVHLNGHPVRRLPGNLNLTFEGVEGEALLLALDLEGIAVSSGSACSSGNTDPSPVLTGMGLSPEEAQSSLRITLGRSNNMEEIEKAAKVIISKVKSLRALAGETFSTGADTILSSAVKRLV